jgi:hypothetical protein
MHHVYSPQCAVSECTTSTRLNAQSRNAPRLLLAGGRGRAGAPDCHSDCGLFTRTILVQVQYELHIAMRSDTLTPHTEQRTQKRGEVRGFRVWGGRNSSMQREPRAVLRGIRPNLGHRPAMASGTVVALLLSLRSATAEVVCACPNQATCGVADLFRATVDPATFESTIPNPTNCVPDVNGHLEADVYILFDALTSVQFPTITSLGGALRVTGAAGLTTLDLPALRHVGGYMWWQENPALATVNVPALESVDGYVKITLAGGLEVLEMPALQSVGQQGLPQSRSVRLLSDSY